MAIQVLKTAQLPVGTYFGNASTNIQHQTSNPLPREGVAALPYTEFLEHSESKIINPGRCGRTRRSATYFCGTNQMFRYTTASP
ncbi:MAG: hypothetical protein RL169_322 [Armatimonadota bacterium]